MAVGQFTSAVTARHRRQGNRFCLRCRKREAEGEFDFYAHLLQGDPGGGAQEPVVAHLHKACWQHVLKEATDELQGIECQGALAVAARLFVAKEDRAVLDLDDAAVGDRHPKDVGGEVLDRGLGAADGLGVDVPVGVPDLAGNLSKQPRLGHPLAKDGAIDL